MTWGFDSGTAHGSFAPQMHAAIAMRFLHLTLRCFKINYAWKRGIGMREKAQQRAFQDPRIAPG
jgi:hypothetical protein